MQPLGGLVATVPDADCAVDWLQGGLIYALGKLVERFREAVFMIQIHLCASQHECACHCLMQQTCWACSA